MAGRIPLTSKAAGELNVHYYREGALREKNLRGRDRVKKGEKESSWVGGKHLVVVEAWP